ncbi:hypothetical protein FHR95_000369 [Halomonas fontilapidosi]|uniref:Uncharacterized protein n=1 Tax=Halomonas fontilapidosi TaxID=616675 RepID=A0A7W5DH52_9GAMM|nr:hypothetical protein [Halomonas fontilapidosi]
MSTDYHKLLAILDDAVNQQRAHTLAMLPHHNIKGS